MAPATAITLIPDKLDLKLYGGDGIQFSLTVAGSDGNPIALTGAVEAQIRSTRVNPDVSAQFNVEITDVENGVAVLSLTGQQTRSLHGDPDAPDETFKGVWDVQWVSTGGEPLTLLQGVVESNIDVTRP
jgi:hypothetical protein